MQFPSIMTPVLDSIDAISCTCEKVLSEMTSEPITGEHYNILEVQIISIFCKKKKKKIILEIRGMKRKVLKIDNAMLYI